MTIETFTYVGNTVTINGEAHEVLMSLPHNIKAVQYHADTGKYFEETDKGLKEVKAAKYQVLINEWGAKHSKRLEEDSKMPDRAELLRNKKQAESNNIQATYKGKTFNGSISGQQQIALRIAALADDTTEIGVIDTNDSIVMLTRPELKDILFELIMQYNAIITQKE